MRRSWALGMGALLLASLAWAGSDADPTKLQAEISRSGGQKGGIVVLWPRVIPRSDKPQDRADASFIQQQLQNVAERVLPGRPIDRRPEPERVCPRAGCDGISVGAVFLHEERGCAVVATVTRPGQSPSKLVTMSGALSLKALESPFRGEPPESFVVVHDFDRCTEIGAMMQLRMAALEAALREAGGAEATPTAEAAPSRVVISGGSPP